MNIFDEILDFFKNKNFEISRRFSKNQEYTPTPIKNLLNKLRNPQDDYKTIHIAGTYGKSSMAHYMSRLLHADSLTCGLYTSPHLLKFNERFLINNQPITNREVEHIWDGLLPLIENKFNISFFDCLTTIAFIWFKEKKVDWAVIETGLGGRLDSTNIIVPEFCIITSIGLDHINILGDTIEKIAYEKVGIIKEKIKVYTYNQNEKIYNIIQKQSKLKKSTYQNISINSGEVNFENYNHENLYYCKKIFNDFFQKKNKRIDIQLKGHLQILLNQPLVIYDSAHNQQSIEYLIKYITSNYSKFNIKLFFNITKDRDILSFIDSIKKSFAKKEFEVYLLLEKDNQIIHNEMNTNQLYIRRKRIDEIKKMIQLDITNSNESKQSLYLFTGSTYIYKIVLEIIDKIII